MGTDLAHASLRLMQSLFDYLKKLSALSPEHYDAVAVALKRSLHQAIPDTHRFWFDQKIAECRPHGTGKGGDFDQAVAAIVKDYEVQARAAGEKGRKGGWPEEQLEYELELVAQQRDAKLLECAERESPAGDGVARIRESLIPGAKASQAALSALQSGDYADD